MYVNILAWKLDNSETIRLPETRELARDKSLLNANKATWHMFSLVILINLRMDDINQVSTT